MKTLADALAQRERIFGAFEEAEVEEDDEARRAWLTFVVVGGGPTGVEISGQIAELSHRALKGNFRRFDPARDVKVLLFEGGKDILATFGDKLSAKGTKALEKTGVEVHTGSIVTGVDADGVDVKGPDGTVTRYPAKTKIWAAGVSASPLAKMLADATGADARPRRPDQGPAGLLAAGPSGGLRGRRHDEPQRPSGRRRGRAADGIHAARTIRRRLDGEESLPFKYRDLGSMAAISRRRAVVSFHGIRVTGFLGWVMWMFVHLAFLTGFKNRFKTVISWMLSFIGSGRTERALTGRIEP